jgi:hypothetical protein
LQQWPVAHQPGKHRRQDVVGDVCRRVDEVEEVTRDPEYGLDSGDRRARSGLHECIEAAGADHRSRVAEPDKKGRDESRNSKQGNENGVIVIADDSWYVQRHQRQRTAGRDDRQGAKGAGRDRLRCGAVAQAQPPPADLEAEAEPEGAAFVIALPAELNTYHSPPLLFCP